MHQEIMAMFTILFFEKVLSGADFGAVGGGAHTVAAEIGQCPPPGRTEGEGRRKGRETFF